MKTTKRNQSTTHQDAKCAVKSTRRERVIIVVTGDKQHASFTRKQAAAAVARLDSYPPRCSYSTD